MNGLASDLAPSAERLPVVLVVDDVFGRTVVGGANPDRESLCVHFNWLDVTGDASSRVSKVRVNRPSAAAFFCRGQKPAGATVGDRVQNDLDAVMRLVREPPRSRLGGCGWAMVLLDLCFYTGEVRAEDEKRMSGVPLGTAADSDSREFFGLTILDAIHREQPDLPVLVLSGKPRGSVSSEISRRGALGFIDRTDAVAPRLLHESLVCHGLTPDSRGEILGRSHALLLALREARRASLHRHHLVICGERGAGKDLVARYIHRNGSADRPFVPVNSAVFTPQLFSSEFFGIEAGTATGVTAKRGLIETANGGDLFLDEIGELPVEAQAGILRVLQDGHYTRVGGTRPFRADVRVIAATNADLGRAASGFRADLLDRLRVGGQVALPPLRDRLDDIPLLAEAFVRDAERTHHSALRRVIGDDAIEALASHSWPGNIRELRSVLFDAVNRYPDVEYLVPAHLRIEARKTTFPVSKLVPAAVTKAPAAGLSALLDALRGVEFDPRNVAEWMGHLRTLQHEQARVAARLLGAAIEATKRRTPEHPDGLIQIQPAARLATGDTTLTASKAADLFKRTLGPIADELEGDLLEAYQIALRLRPRSGGATRRVDP